MQFCIYYEQRQLIVSLTPDERVKYKPTNWYCDFDAYPHFRAEVNWWNGIWDSCICPKICFNASLMRHIHKWQQYPNPIESKCSRYVPNIESISVNGLSARCRFLPKMLRIDFKEKKSFFYCEKHTGSFDSGTTFNLSSFGSRNLCFRRKHSDGAFRSLSHPTFR